MAERFACLRSQPRQRLPGYPGVKPTLAGTVRMLQCQYAPQQAVLALVLLSGE